MLECVPQGLLAGIGYGSGLCNVNTVAGSTVFFGFACSLPSKKVLSAVGRYGEAARRQPCPCLVLL